MVLPTSIFSVFFVKFMASGSILLCNTTKKRIFPIEQFFFFDKLNVSVRNVVMGKSIGAWNFWSCWFYSLLIGQTTTDVTYRQKPVTTQLYFVLLQDSCILLVEFQRQKIVVNFTVHYKGEGHKIVIFILYDLYIHIHSDWTWIRTPSVLRNKNHLAYRNGEHFQDNDSSIHL